MNNDPKISLDCPYCEASICQSLSWFKKTYATCPSCDKGLSAGQFEAVIADLEAAMEASTDEMVHGKPHGGCCGKTSCG
ncbi:MAG: hypothetical protein C0616_14020 [Desulfuromonas sp.]|nr:MAG: hypothetical protein C0616_14020 [Desulfuromonas sp.]